jgi:hypothetical protein
MRTRVEYDNRESSFSELCAKNTTPGAGPDNAKIHFFL